VDYTACSITVYLPFGIDISLLTISGLVLDWYRDYLCGRMQTLQAGSLLSGPQALGAVCHKGLFLARKKFIAYTEDRANVISRNQLGYQLYADDTQLV